MYINGMMSHEIENRYNEYCCEITVVILRGIVQYAPINNEIPKIALKPESHENIYISSISIFQ